MYKWMDSTVIAQAMYNAWDNSERRVWARASAALVLIRIVREEEGDD